MSVTALPRLNIAAAANKLRDNESVSDNPPSPILSPTCTFQECPARVSTGTNEPLLLAERYLLLEYVDSGSYGSTSLHRRCVDTVTGEELVCRQLPAGPSSSSVVLEAHSRLADSEYITPIRQCVQTMDPQGRQMSFLLWPRSYGDLHSYLRTKKRLRESEARNLFRQVAETVLECHSKGIVLGDLRLRKFVFTDEQRTKIQLELLEEAVILDSSSDDFICRKQGYPAYVTPEVIVGRGGKCSGRATDIWALGVILYTLVVGRYPFQDYSPLALFTKILRGSFSIPDFVSSRAKCLIRSLLRRDPSKRLTADDILKHPWFSATLRCDRVDRIDSKENAVRSSPVVKKTSRNRHDDQVVPQDLLGTTNF